MGTRPSFGERVEATRRAAAAEAGQVTDEPPRWPDPACWPPMPPEPGPWVFMLLPDGRGGAWVRPREWVRDSDGTWVLHVYGPPGWYLAQDWVSGGTQSQVMEMGQYPPADHVRQVEGQDYSGISRPE